MKKKLIPAFCIGLCLSLSAAFPAMAAETTSTGETIFTASAEATSAAEVLPSAAVYPVLAPLSASWQNVPGYDWRDIYVITISVSMTNLPSETSTPVFTLIRPSSAEHPLLITGFQDKENNQYSYTIYYSEDGRFYQLLQTDSKILYDASRELFYLENDGRYLAFQDNCLYEADVTGETPAPQEISWTHSLEASKSPAVYVENLASYLSAGTLSESDNLTSEELFQLSERPLDATDEDMEEQPSTEEDMEEQPDTEEENASIFMDAQTETPLSICNVPLKDLLERTYPETLTELTAVSPDVKGMISIDGTYIDYPLMQGTDNEFYLRHALNGEWNNCGSIFIDFRNQNPFEEFHTFIYGHNQKNNKIFHALLNYQSEEYFKKHPYINIDTPKKSYLFQIYSAYQTPITGFSFYCSYGAESAEEYANYLTEAKAASIYDTGLTPSPSKPSITLVTCTNILESTDRFLVQATLISSTDKQ